MRFYMLLILLCANLNAYCGELLLNGVYQGKNVYVQNPFSSDKKEFCTEEVYVNDVKMLSNIRNSAYTINLSALRIGSSVSIKITYKDDCSPKIINPEVLKKEEIDISFKSITILNDSIVWEVNTIDHSGKFIIEKFTETYWKPVVTTPTIESKTYSYPFTPELSRGLTKIRIKYLSATGKVTLTQELQPLNKDEITVSR